MANGEDDGQEKTLEPTDQRLEKARQDGDVPKSMDLAAAAGYMGLLVALAVSSGSIALGFSEPLSGFLRSPETMIDRLLGPGGPQLAALLLTDAFIAVAPVFVVPMAAVIVVLLAQRAIVFAPSKLEPKLSRLDPISNAGQKFGPTGLVEFLKSVVKLIAIAVILGLVLVGDLDGLAAMVAMDAKALPTVMRDQGLMLLAAAMLIVGVIAALDVVWQQYDHRRKLRMSQQDMKDEAKETEGDPYMKMTRRQRGREIAMNRMIQDVEKADVVIVNPTHYAVALDWSREPGAAPVCVAKGVDEIAAKIREAAETHGVPIHSDPPTARALYATVELGDEIPGDQYQAVAIAIRFADAARMAAMKRKAAGLAPKAPDGPPPWTDADR